MGREQILRAIECSKDSPAAFLKLLECHTNHEDPLDLAEFFQGLPRKQHSRAWSAALNLTQATVERMAQSSEEDRSPGEMLDAVVTLCQCALSQETPVIPDEFRDTLQTLHDIMLSLPMEALDLQNRISQLCEQCWVREVEGREGIVPHCLLYLVARTLTDGAVQSDVKRVWAMRQALLLLDFEDSSADSIKHLLLSCLIEPLYLYSEEGKKLLSFLFGLHPVFVEDLHQTVRSQLPHCPKAHLEVYGEVYFRAWRLAAGPYLKQLEEQCVQDLMYCAVHAQNTGPHSLFNALRRVLGYIHQQRQQKGVSEMLLRLYNPFLWRSLKVANAHVRANAAVLLLDVFPLHDPDTTREEIDTILQKQFDLMADLLEDTSPMVRALTSVGVCRVLSYYWELTPPAVIRTLLLRMVKDLTWDATSVNVRVAVIQGLCVLLENRLSHSLLRDILPLLQNHIHDSSEKVRIAFLDLLLLVKGMRSLKFWKICPVDHLLARMEIDSVHVVKRVVALLVDSFQPTNIPPQQQIARCITLLELNPGAAHRFYQLAVTHLTPARVVRFLLAIHSAVWHCVEGGEEGGVKGGGEEEEVMEEEEEEEEGGKEEAVKNKRKGKKNNVMGDMDGGPHSPQDATDDPTGVSQGGWRKEEGGGSERDSSTTSPLSLADTDVIGGLLEVMVILWEGAKERLNSPSNRSIRSKLEAQVAQTLPLFFNTLTDGRCRSALYLLSSYLPKKSVAPVMKGTLETLSSLDHSSQDYTAMLVALLSWKQSSHVIKLISQWLSAGLGGCGQGGGASTEDEAEHQKVKGKGRRQRRGGGRGGGGGGGGGGGRNFTDCSQSVLALNMLNWMMLHPLCYQELKTQQLFWRLEDVLKRTLELLESHFSPSSNATPNPVTFDLLLGALSMYIRLAMHRAESGDVECVRERVGEVRVWSDRVILPLLRGETKSQPPKRHSNRKRKANQSHPPLTSDPRFGNASRLTEMALELLSEVVMVGLSDGDLRTDIAEFAASIAESASAPLLLPPLCKLLYQLTEASTICEVEGIRSDSGLTPVATLLQPLLQLSGSTASANPDTFKKVWSHIQPCVGNAVLTSLRFHVLLLTPHTLSPVSVLVSVVMSSLTEHIKEHPSHTSIPDVPSMPPFPSAVLHQTCRDEHITSMFLSHLHSSLPACGDGPLPDVLLRHKAAINIISALSNSKQAEGELIRCVRSTLKLVDLIKVTENEQWFEEIEELSQLVELLQDKLFH